MRRAVFLDRDGVIIANRTDYVKSWGEVEFLPGVLDAMRRLAGTEYAVVLITNQSAVGRGIVSLRTAMELNAQVVAEIVRHGGRLDGSYLCPHRPDEGCFCRKPAPGMLVQAARDLVLDLNGSHVVGDATTDMQAAIAVGASGVLVLTGRGAAQLQEMTPCERQRCAVKDDLSAAVSSIVSLESSIV